MFKFLVILFLFLIWVNTCDTDTQKETSVTHIKIDARGKDNGKNKNS